MFRKKREQNKPEKINKFIKIFTIASLPIEPYVDFNNMCFDIIQSSKASDVIIIDKFLDSFYKANLSTFNSYPTGKITLSNTDFSKIINSHQSYINDICEITGKSYNQVVLDFATYHKEKEFMIQPTGISGIIHKATNGIYIASSITQSAVATATSHVSGVTGMPLLGSAPGLIIFVPLVGGVFFGSLERLAANTPAQPVFVIARDICLIPPKIAEVAYNELFVGPVLRWFNIDAPLNVTSMLRFGNGTKRIWVAL